MTFAQTSSDSAGGVKAAVAAVAPDAAAATAAAAPKKSKAGTTPAVKSDPGDNQALKKKWCVENVEATFMNADGAPRTSLQ